MAKGKSAGTPDTPENSSDTVRNEGVNDNAESTNEQAQDAHAQNYGDEGNPASQSGADLAGAPVTGESTEEDIKAAQEFQEGRENQSDLNLHPNPPVAKPNGRILAAGDPISFEGEKVGNMIVVKEDVYREVIPFRAKRPTYVLLYRAGTQVSETTVQALEANVQGADTNAENKE